VILSMFVMRSRLPLTFINLFKILQDMQLWKMLGRKVNNLGRVVDGERNISMGAQKAGLNGKGAGLSGQDELQSFFAEAQVRDEKVSKVPAKGTIMSFFAKQKQKIPQSSSKVPNNISKESATKLSKSSQKTCIFGNPSKENPTMIEWDCEACTFHNKQRQHFSDSMACEICGAQHTEVIGIDDRDIPSRKVTPSSLRKGEISQSLIAHQTNQLIKPSKPEIVTIDGMEEEQRIDVVPRKLDSSLKNPIILCDVPEEASSSRKKRKVNHRQPQSKPVSTIVFPISNQDRSKAKSTTLLSFSVSKNSGRITVHFSESGESSLTNFQVENIVTKETVDLLMEAQLSRNYNAIPSINLVYDQSALSKGKQTNLFKISYIVGPITISQKFQTLFHFE
jgi:hypothetical protein